MVEFAGWLMPVQYAGIIEEHLHTRSKAGLFDTCHMGEFYVRGPHAAKAVDRLVTCRLDNLHNGQARYGFFLNEKGGVVDDLIVFRLAVEEYLLVVNAGTLDKDRAWVEAHLEGDVDFSDESYCTAKLDLQGPASSGVMAAVIGSGSLAMIERFRFRHVLIDGIEVLVSRTGYTGEAGFELFFEAGAAGRIWDRLIDFESVRPVGLGARDTLRLEKGLSLYGHEIDEEHTPLEAGLKRFVHFEKDFIGRDALMKQEREGVARSLKGFVCEGRRSPRHGFEIRRDGEVVGSVTSGVFSPCLKCGIAMGYVNLEGTADGGAMVLTDGKAEIRATIQAPPFV